MNQTPASADAVIGVPASAALPEAEHQQARMPGYGQEELFGERMGAAGGDRWQGGECGTYATALQRMRPGLMIGAAGGGPGDDEEDWDVEHFFAHDQTHAYDSTGRHELPYSGRWQHSMLNINPHHFDVLSAEHPPDSAEAERAIAQAERHIIRHRILEGGEPTQYPGPDPLEDRRPGGLDELPPSDLDATRPQPGRHRAPGTHQPEHLRKTALPHEDELEAEM